MAEERAQESLTHRGTHAESVEERTQQASAERLRDQLDVLWEKHLLLLDRYQQAQQQLGRHLSSGFFSLAQATFKSPSRIRYGQDYYDDRMQATCRFSASLNNSLPYVALQTEDTEEVLSPAPDQDTTSRSADDSSPRPSQQQPTPPSTPPPELQEEEHTEDGEAEKTKKPPNPLHWFGILVPPQLRSSQQSFKSAVEDPIIDAAISAQALRLQSLEIRKLRKEIKKAEKRTS